MNNQFLIECKCHRCGTTGESSLSISGPHIKQSCPNCGWYVKFIKANLIPNKIDIKVAIYHALNGNLSLVDEHKKSCGFNPNLTGMSEVLEYYKLYKQIKS